MRSMFSYDPTLRAAVDASPQSIGEVVQILQAIEATCADGDGLKWFNGLYLEVTQAVETRVNADGFADPDWIAALDVEFASTLPRLHPRFPARRHPDAGRRSLPSATSR